MFQVGCECGTAGAGKCVPSARRVATGLCSPQDQHCWLQCMPPGANGGPWPPSSALHLKPCPGRPPWHAAARSCSMLQLGIAQLPLRGAARSEAASPRVCTLTPCGPPLQHCAHAQARTAQLRWVMTLPALAPMALGTASMACQAPMVCTGGGGLQPWVLAFMQGQSLGTGGMRPASLARRVAPHPLACSPANPRCACPTVHVAREQPRMRMLAGVESLPLPNPAHRARPLTARQARMVTTALTRARLRSTPRH